jgi:conjugal transfer pilin signal peptidase TrbI
MQARRLYWSLCTGVFALGLLALAASPWLILSVNLSGSLPGTLYLIHKGAAVKKGDLLAFRWPGGATYPAGTPFIKRVAGVAGDRVERVDDMFWVEGRWIGHAKPFSKAGVALQAAPGGIVGTGEYFVATPNPDSLDSRYALTGNVRQAAVIGRAYEVF